MSELEQKFKKQLTMPFPASKLLVYFSIWKYICTSYFTGKQYL